MQDPVLQFIQSFITKHGRAPTKQEIYDFVDPRQPGPINRMLDALARVGEISAERRAK